MSLLFCLFLFVFDTKGEAQKKTTVLDITDAEIRLPFSQGFRFKIQILYRLAQALQLNSRIDEIGEVFEPLKMPPSPSAAHARILKLKNVHVSVSINLTHKSGGMKLCMKTGSFVQICSQDTGITIIEKS